MKITRKHYVTEDDLKAAKPEELTGLIFEKAKTNPEGWTAGAAVSVNIGLLHEGEWSRTQLKKHRSGRKPGALGIARKEIKRLASKCRDWHAMVSELQVEMRREGASITDVDEEEQLVRFVGKVKAIKFATLMDYFDTAKGWSKGTTRAKNRK